MTADRSKMLSQVTPHPKKKPAQRMSKAVLMFKDAVQRVLSNPEATKLAVQIISTIDHCMARFGCAKQTHRDCNGGCSTSCQ